MKASVDKDEKIFVKVVMQFLTVPSIEINFRKICLYFSSLHARNMLRITRH